MRVAGFHQREKKIGSEFTKIQDPDQQPTGVKDHPDHIIIKLWAVNKIYDCCYLPYIEDPDDEHCVIEHSTYFWCSLCKKWLKTANTMGNINYHYKKTKKHPEWSTILPEEEVYERVPLEKRQAAAKRFIMKNGLGKNAIEDEDLRLLAPGLPGRKEFTQEIETEANIIIETLKQMLSNVRKTTLSFDEWTSLVNDRYLGITVHCLYYGRMKCMSLAHIPLIIKDTGDEETDLTVRAADIGTLVQETINRYELDKKVSNIVSDNAAVMIASVKYINNQRSIAELDPLLWTPCCCHTLNLIIDVFVANIEHQINQFKAIQSRLGSSTKFTAYCRSMDNLKVHTIPTYVKSRWYSLFNMIKAIVTLKVHIINFYNKELREPINEEIFINAEYLLSPFRELKFTTKMLESEDFGVIGLLFAGFEAVRQAFSSICRFREAKEKFKEAYALHMDKYKKEWSPILEAATILVPSNEAVATLSAEQYSHGLEFLKNKVREYKAENYELTREVANRNALPPSQEVEDQFPRIHLSSRAKVAARPIATQNSIEFGPKRKASSISKFISRRANASGENHAQVSEDEVNTYLSESAGKKKIGPEYWLMEHEDIPNLTMVARDILSIIPASASTERQFSKSRRVLGYSRLQLNQNNLESEMMLVGNGELMKKSFE